MKTTYRGIQKSLAHPKALALFKGDFFWDSRDQLAPFGAMEGYQSLKAYLLWRETAPQADPLEFVSDWMSKKRKLNLAQYGPHLLNRKKIEAQIADRRFRDELEILSTDSYLLAACLAPLVLEGELPCSLWPYLQTAMDRLMLWNELQPEFGPECSEQIMYLYQIKQELQPIFSAQ